MAVKINPPFIALTSPPAAPSKQPDTTIYPTVMEYGDRKVWVSVVLPDTIELVCTVLLEHSLVPDQSQKSEKLKYVEFDQDILENLANSSALEPGGFVTVGKQIMASARRSTTFNISYDPAQPLNRAFFTLSRSLTEGVAEWRARLEFSPANAGAGGLKRIVDGVLEIGLVDLEKMMPDLRISRIDAAVDCIGVEPLDLIAHAPGVGKRQVWLGNNGRPESVYLFARKALPEKPYTRKGVRTHGPQRLTLYERRSYFEQLGVEPPFGGAPVTRVEVSKRWLKARPPLAGLALLANMFEKRRVAYAGAVDTKRPQEWAKFCIAAFGAGPEKAKWIWLTKSGHRLAQFYLNCTGDLVSESCWSSWADGLTQTGLSAWVALATKHDQP